jgi:hypothetical protein
MMKAEVDDALKLIFSNVSPLKRSRGAVAAPVVLPLRNSWHTVYEPTDAPIFK